MLVGVSVKSGVAEAACTASAVRKMAVSTASWVAVWFCSNRAVAVVFNVAVGVSVGRGVTVGNAVLDGNGVAVGKGVSVGNGVFVGARSVNCAA